MMERNLVFIINEKNEYARHLASLLASIGENSKVRWNIFIIYIELSEKSRENLVLFATFTFIDLAVHEVSFS